MPCHITIRRFCIKLNKEGHLQPLLNLINDQLNQRGVLIQPVKASIIEATVIEAKNHLRFQSPSEFDEDNFILAQTLTTGSQHDSNVFEVLLTDLVVR